jgi:xanthine dehydrogenase accessory factor
LQAASEAKEPSQATPEAKLAFADAHEAKRPFTDGHANETTFAHGTRSEMNELERIVREVARLESEASPYLLATVVRVSGSSYRRPGARMLISGDRWISGCVSGGCLESDVMMRGAHRCRSGPVVVHYDTTDDGDAWGLGCNGTVDLLLELVSPGRRNDALAFAQACFHAEVTGALATVIQSENGSVSVGTRVAIGARSDLVRVPAELAVRQAMEHAARGAAGVVELPRFGVAVLVERIAPSPQLFVLGSSHDSAPVVMLAQSAGMRVVLADRVLREERLFGADRVIATGGSWEPVRAAIDQANEAFVLIKHHQRDADREALAVALASRARYIGVLGPLRRTRELLAELGHAPDVDERLHAPAGLDLGAETPEQIALAIVGEIEAVRHCRAGGTVRERVRGLHADVATAVLAAGGSHRFGSPKQLAELDGRPLVQRVVRECILASAGPVAAITGANAEAVADTLGDLPVTVIVNGAWTEGLASSIHAAVRWAETTHAGALAIVLADQPLLTARHLTGLRDAWLKGADLVASRFAEIVGAPAVFDRSRWNELEVLEGDEGARSLLRSKDVVAIDWPEGAFDIDTAEDFAKLREREAIARGGDVAASCKTSARGDDLATTCETGGRGDDVASSDRQRLTSPAATRPGACRA